MESALASRRPPISRDVTASFVLLRRNWRDTRRWGPLLLGRPPRRDGGAYRQLLDVEGGPRKEASAGAAPPLGDLELALSSRPPPWAEAAAQAREDIRCIEGKLVQLARAQQRRLLKVFGDGGAAGREVEAVASEITALLHRCEQAVHKLKAGDAAKGSGQHDAKVRENLQRSLASRLQQLSQQFRQSQRDLLRELRRRERGLEATPTDSAVESADAGFTDAQQVQLEDMEFTSGQRSVEITRVAATVRDLNTMFKEFAVLVIDQGSILDRIDYNIERVVETSAGANKQLRKAAERQSNNRAMRCIMVLVIINSILTIILTAKTRS